MSFISIQLFSLTYFAFEALHADDKKNLKQNIAHNILALHDLKDGKRAESTVETLCCIIYWFGECVYSKKEWEKLVEKKVPLFQDNFFTFTVSDLAFLIYRLRQVLKVSCKVTKKKYYWEETGYRDFKMIEDQLTEWMNKFCPGEQLSEHYYKYHDGKKPKAEKKVKKKGRDFNCTTK